MSWCPYIKNSNSTIFQNNAKYLSNEKNTIPNTIPILLEKTPLEGLTKEALIVKIYNVALVFFIFIYMILTLITYSYNSPLCYELKPELIYVLLLILYFIMAILHFIQSHSTIEISTNCIKVDTLFHRITGSTTYSLESIHSIQVKDNEIYRLNYKFVFIIAIPLLFIFFSLPFIFQLIGMPLKNVIILYILFFCLIIFLFSTGYYSYIASKSSSSIQIKFRPYPFFNRIRIHTKNACQIADMLAQVNKHEHKLDIDEKKDSGCSE